MTAMAAAAATASAGNGPRRVGDLAFAIDALTVAGVSVAICVASQDLASMSAVVPGLLALRLAAWMLLGAEERGRGRLAELAFFALSTVLGAFNDWSSVTRHRVYDYTVPTDLPGLSHIPVWMLLYWGMVLRFMATLFRWRRLDLPPAPPGALRAGVLLAIVVVTRQCIYRLFDHPLWSWLPFALALGLALVMLRLDRRRLALLAGVLVLGPAVEVLYIQVGHLHAYRLGWFLGVPLWIVLWGGLAALAWEVFGGRVQRFLDERLASTRPTPIRA